MTATSPLASRIERIRTLGGIRNRDVAQLLATTPETVSRWSSGKIEPQRDRLKHLLNLEYLVDELAQFYSPEEAKLWLFAPHRLLGGETPAEKIQRGELDDVLGIIAQLQDGTYG
jgi:transcriptional regulator with XRE-family HTH domain